MADPHAAAAAALTVTTESTGQPPSFQAPLLPPTTPDNLNHRFHQHQDDSRLDQTLKRLEIFLTSLGFNQSSVLGFLLSWTAFLLVGVAAPVIVLEYSNCSGCKKYQIKAFELDIVASQASLAAVSLLCLSHNLRKYGIRKFLLVDRCSGHMSRFRDEYINHIKVSTIVQVVGIILCLHGATKISHRAQGIASLANRWHAILTCDSSDGRYQES